MLNRGDRIGVAVSGGADSVFLLDALAELGLAAAVLHVNHKLRGEESEGDEQFVRGLASKLGLPVYVAAQPVAPGNVEQEARSVRYAFFTAKISEGCCDAVATGHTKDDQAETVLGRFLRGSGTAGLSGIRPTTSAGIVRPLLDLGRRAIRDSLRSRDLPWREDGSNLDLTFLRNRIRLDILPQLATVNPSLPDVLASFAEWARDEEDYWQIELSALERKYLIRRSEAILVRTGDMNSLPVATQRRLIRLMVERVKGNLRAIDFRHVEAIRTLMQATEGSGRLQLPDLDIYRSFDWLRFAPIGIDSRLQRDFSVALNFPGVTEVPGRGIAVVMEPAGPESVCYRERVYNEDVYLLDKQKCAGQLQLRNWRPGDRFQPVGRTSPEKIKTMFQENRIPLWERRNWPVIVRDQSILWTRQFGAAREFAAVPASKQILIVRETRESNPVSGASIPVEASSSFTAALCMGDSHTETGAGFPKEAL